MRLLDLGVSIQPAVVDAESGVSAVRDLFGAGQLRVFSTMDEWLRAYRQYHRDDRGDLIEDGDDLMRTTALLGLFGRDIAVTERRARNESDDEDPTDDRWGTPAGTGY